MKIEEIARTILFGTSLEEKLIQWSFPLNLEELDPSQTSARTNSFQTPSFPGRPNQLTKSGKVSFPSIHQLHHSLERGKVLHFFANHELLAMELMALVLLRFPEAPLSFRHGLLRTIQEEQQHLSLYLSRMKELGVEFGDLPLSDYFWNTMKHVTSPLDFTVQMSLTFEQANLDFSLFFKNAIAKTGDQPTTAILERVFQEEIKHVRHGLTWFNRWRGISFGPETDWDAYVRLLPPPLTPQRAKGFEFSEEPRRRAGLSETFIQNLRHFSSSKGRPPTLWFYNPHCDSEIARGHAGFTAKGGTQKLSKDLEHLPLFLCKDSDLILVSKKPKLEWLESIQMIPVPRPEFVEIPQPPKPLTQWLRTPKLGGVEPWGWSPDQFLSFQPLLPRLFKTSGENSDFCKRIFALNNYSETGLGTLFSKSWSVTFLREWLEQHPHTSLLFGEPKTVGSSFYTWESAYLRIQEILNGGDPVMIKAPYGTSGMQVRKILKFKDLSDSLKGWIQNILASQSAIIIEHLLEKLFDLSIQLEVKEDRINLLEVRQFMTGIHSEYLGTYLGRSLPELGPEHHRFFQQAKIEWHQLLHDLGIKLRSLGYIGPAGVDAFLWRDKDGSLKLKPLVELNPRWTMGRVALELEKYLAPRVNGIWKFVPVKEIKKQGFESPESYAQEMRRRHPLKTRKIGNQLRIESGVIFTNDPSSTQSVLTVLATLPNGDFSVI